MQCMWYEIYISWPPSKSHENTYRREIIFMQCDEKYTRNTHNTLHKYGFSPVCLFLWLSMWPDWVNFLSHTLHENDSSPVCVLMWYLRNIQGHVVLWIPYHILCMNMVSLLCVFMWLWRWHVYVNLLSHTLHEYSFSPVCVVMWHYITVVSLLHVYSCDLPACVNFVSHILHEYGLSPVYAFMWHLRLIAQSTYREETPSDWSVTIEVTSSPHPNKNKHEIEIFSGRESPVLHSKDVDSCCSLYTCSLLTACMTDSGFSPVCVLMWHLRLPASMNFLWHTLHEYGSLLYMF